MGNAFSHLFPNLWGTRFRLRDFDTYRKPVPKGIFIALVGQTGSGMSRLIHDATGSYETGVSPEGRLDSDPYTASIQDFGFTIPGIIFSDFPLYFIDTPGFDYASTNNEHAALLNLRSWIRMFKPLHTKVDGLVFMHNICTDELPKRPTFLPRHEVIEDLCGKNNWDRITFVSSHWHDLEPGRTKLKESEINAYWAWMRARNSKMEKYETPSSQNAWKILKPFVMNAQVDRERRLKEELENLKIHVSENTYQQIDDFLDRKAAFMKEIIGRLGEEEGFSMIEDEERVYKELHREAVLLWKEVEKELNVDELERWLTSGRKEADRQ
ncbi:hypothetical protein AGABI1DRAFT_130262 [Agaricus bisporus var. burnettii JB137-S8]|uniref:G domain-containing protein n=1 Tax=Agaricus bisporus var. burnettii (strain JB137-S8 / ATCC MYA-4627 / FGSC 10392) TaxID=597362 RepID=K5X363_AGABU|nr:uncharacterized protein AGABI1DRAFT_130262 [Agaricus bisporus var. burnettii JB137-S8]EKM77568.1 hypothetical protein AGABI1DRAFT_130262 [Agaricus bisporus var. burnettii JB137-S8]